MRCKRNEVRGTRHDTCPELKNKPPPPPPYNTEASLARSNFLSLLEIANKYKGVNV